MNNLPYLVPDPLKARGHIDVTDADAVECFDAFDRWAKRVSNQGITEFPWVVQFYAEFWGKNSDELPEAPPSEASDFVESWIDPDRYVPSQQLHDGFFKRVDAISAGEDTLLLRGRWVEFASSMRDCHGRFEISKAKSTIFNGAIEVQQTTSDTYMHCLGFGGRHRLLAMKVLKAPALPVLLRKI